MTRDEQTEYMRQYRKENREQYNTTKILKNIEHIIGLTIAEERERTMMNEQIEEKAIEEMARVIETTEQIARDAHCGLPSPRMYAKDLYWHGYRRQNTGSWIKHSASYECTSCNEEFFVEGYAEDYDPITECDLHFCPNCGARMKGEEK